MRQHSRIIIRSIFRIKVSNRRNDKLVGYVGDLSEHGLRLVGDTLLEVGSTLELRIRMRDKDGQMRHADVDVKCLWARENAQTGHFEAGLSLVLPSVSYSELIRDMRATRGVREES
ncbi:PilZ domain-containing protein [Pseudomonas sp. UL073]|uniref:PilZ domain-containing protein n=1 Tax=Zestomonas insulae TaxID=2809017 RepID=A0ABS2IA78_9GAMM|nr:PilZ domain-containing protein [Pseudomonas insulae]MBM7059159.1 PilZ domain-containing protein [Pseudomonas insulae]